MLDQKVAKLLNDQITKEFYSGDKEAKYYCWTVGNKLFESISFNIIER